MEPTKLERLLISEVSGVDAPANQLDGWMVTKSREGDAALLAVAEEMEVVTKAAATKAPYGDVEYADPGLQEDGKKRYPLDTETHIRAAWSYINQADNAGAYSSGDLAKIKAKISAAMKKIGATVEKSDSNDTTIVAKIKELLLGSPTGKDDLDMDSDELKTILAENNESLAKAVADAVTKSVAPAEGEGTEEATTEVAEVEAPAVEETSDATPEVDIAKSIQEALEPYNTLLEKVLNRIEAVETHLGVAARKSLDGQESAAEGEVIEKSTPDLADAIASAFARR